jgi:hypothetical protein
MNNGQAPPTAQPAPPSKVPPPLHPLQVWGSRAAICSCAIAFIVLVITLINFSRTQSPEEKRRDELLKELSSDYFSSRLASGGTPSNAQDYRDEAAPYINKRLKDLSETWQFDPATNRVIPYR